MTSKSFFMSIFANVEYINSNYMTNLYWPIYKKIEKEIVELSNHIHFDDNQFFLICFPFSGKKTLSILCS